MSLNKRIEEIERKQLPQPRLKVFTQAVDGTIKGDGLKFKNKAEYDKYADEQGFNDGSRIKSVLFVQIVNSQYNESE